MNAFKKLEIGIPLGYHEDITGADIRHTVGILVKDKDMWESMSRNGKILVTTKVHSSRVHGSRLENDED